MTARRITIYVGEPVAALLTHVGEGASVSGRLNTVAERYAEVVRRSAPALSTAQWSALADALNGTVLGVVEIRHMADEVRDCDGLGRKWGVDQAGLADAVDALTFAGRLAGAEIVERFWARQPGSASLSGQLAEAGARMTDAESD